MSSLQTVVAVQTVKETPLLVWAWLASLQPVVQTVWTVRPLAVAMPAKAPRTAELTWVWPGASVLGYRTGGDVIAQFAVVLCPVSACTGWVVLQPRTKLVHRQMVALGEMQAHHHVVA